MSRCHVLLMVALTSLLLTTTASAQLNFGRKCAEGPAKAVVESWGPESSCRCSGLRGGALVGTNNYGFLWSDGRGVVVLELQVRSSTGSLHWGTASTVNNRYFASVDGSGITEPIQSVVGYTWTGMYRATCFLH